MSKLLRRLLFLVRYRKHVADLDEEMAFHRSLAGGEPDVPLTFGAVAALLLTAAAVACRLPARRAMRVEPLIAIRHE